MKFNLKEYQKQKIKQYFKNNSFTILSINANKKAQNWLDLDQELKKLKFSYYKICNKTTKKIVKKSTHKNFANLVNSTFFFLKPTHYDIKINNKTFQQLGSILFSILAIKLNKKIYILNQSKNITLINYKKNISIFYQFLITNVKRTYLIKDRKIN